MSLMALSVQSASRLCDDNGMIERIAGVTGLRTQNVQARLRSADGATKACIVFAQEWPDNPRKLGLVRVLWALRVGLEHEIADFTGLNPARARRRLEEAHSNSTIAMTFRDFWPNTDAAVDSSAQDGKADRAKGIHRNAVKQTADLRRPSVAVRSAIPAAPVPTAPIPPALTPPLRSESDWELGVERLQFLTSLPAKRGHRDPLWPSECVKAAIEGLSISDQERGLMERLAAAWVQGSQNPQALADSLVDQQDHHDLDALIGHFRRLNPEFAGVVEEMVRWIGQRRHVHCLPEQAPNVVPHAAPIRLGAVNAGPSSESPPIRTAPDETVSAPTASEKRKPLVRNLGVLDDMFDD